MDTPLKMHSELAYHRNLTFVRGCNSPAESVFFALLRMESILSHRRLFLDHDFRSRGTFRAPTFALPHVAG
jgi:hypothetical protein